MFLRRFYDVFVFVQKWLVLLMEPRCVEEVIWVWWAHSGRRGGAGLAIVDTVLLS